MSTPPRTWTHDLDGDGQVRERMRLAIDRASIRPLRQTLIERRIRGLAAKPTRVDEFIVFGEIGRGGAASVHLALQKIGQQTRWAVIKRLLPQLAADPRARALFAEETRISACLTHPNIARFYGSGESDGVAYLAFELVDGLSLREITHSVRLPIGAVIDVGIGAATALAAAHEARDARQRWLKIIHRDVSPSNILIGAFGVVKVTDFGLARFEGRGSHTTHQQIRGTQGYVAPEVALQRPITAKVDMFSLGLVLTELLGGQRVFPPTVLIAARTTTAVQSCLQTAPETIPSALRSLLLNMTAVDPNARPDSMRDIATQLKAIRASIRSEGLREFCEREIATDASADQFRPTPTTLTEEANTPEIDETVEASLETVAMLPAYIEPAWRAAAATRPKPVLPDPTYVERDVDSTVDSIVESVDRRVQAFPTMKLSVRAEGLRARVLRIAAVVWARRTEGLRALNLAAVGFTGLVALICVVLWLVR